MIRQLFQTSIRSGYTDTRHLRFMWFFKYFVLIADNRTDCKLDKGRFRDMRGAAANRAPPRPIYTPGSGPLKKSGRVPDDFDREANSKPSSVQDRLRPMHFNNTPQEGNTRPRESIEKLNDVAFSEEKNSLDDGNSVRSNHQGGDGRRRNKKPELPLYVPKKVQEALAKRDVTNRWTTLLTLSCPDGFIQYSCSPVFVRKMVYVIFDIPYFWACQVRCWLAFLLRNSPIFANLKQLNLQIISIEMQTGVRQWKILPKR